MRLSARVGFFAASCRSRLTSDFFKRRRRIGKTIPVIASLCVLLFLYVAVPHYASIASAQGYTNREANTNADVPANQHTHTQTVLIELSAAIICQLAGVDIITPDKGCLGVDTASKKIGYAPTTPDGTTPQVGGLLGMSTGMISALYIQPASGVEYMAQTINDFGIVKKAQAQENLSGFDQLNPLKEIWETARDMTYIFFVLIFILIGIGIMLRFKIDPRTVMSIQNQLPKVIIAILMITFSYSIVGFFIDLMWVTTYVGVNMVSSASTARTPTCGDDNGYTLQESAYSSLLSFPLVFTNNIFKGTFVQYDVFFQGDNKACQDSGVLVLAGTVGQAAGSLVSEFAEVIFPHPSPDKQCLDTGFLFIGGDFNPETCIAGAISGVVGIFAMVFGTLVALIAILFVMFRLWWTLLKAYAYIIIYTILGPFWILFGLIPGSTLNFSGWLRAILSKLLAFPAAAVLIMLAKVMLDVYHASEKSPTSQLFVPPLMGNPNAAAFGPLVAFAVLMIVPEVVNLMDGALKSPQGKMGDVVKQGFSTGSAVVGGVIGANLSKTFHVDHKSGHSGSGATFVMNRIPALRRRIIEAPSKNYQAIKDKLADDAAKRAAKRTNP